MSALGLLSASPPLFVGICAVLGLIVGSFLNVVIWRLPIMLERQWREQCAEGLALVDSAVGAQGPAAAATVADAAKSGSHVPAAAPARFNLVVPRSACPTCQAPITALQNIPMLSWLLLRGRCARCGAAISARYPLVEALTAALSALVAWKFGFGWQMLLPVILLAAASGAVIGLGLIALRRHDRTAPIPFGPFLAGAGWLMLMCGPQLIRGYFGLFAVPT